MRILPISCEELFNKVTNEIQPNQFMIHYVPKIQRALYFINILKKKESVINEPILPLGDLVTDAYGCEFYSKKQFLKYVRKFFEIFLEEYKILIDNNFPMHRDKFKTYKLLPCYLVGEIKEVGDICKYAVQFVMFKENNGTNQIEISINDSTIFDFNNFIISTSKGKREFFSTNGHSASLFFAKYSNKSVGIIQDYIYRTIGPEVDTWLNLIEP
jgi:hypothetical protein